jgi:magnesium-transporting ATPase (P-type)
MEKRQSDINLRISPILETLGFFFILVCGAGFLLWCLWFFYPHWKMSILGGGGPDNILETNTPLSFAGILVLAFIFTSAYTCHALFERRKKWAYYLTIALTIVLAYHIPVTFQMKIKNNEPIVINEWVTCSFIALFFIIPLIKRRGLFH